MKRYTVWIILALYALVVAGCSKQQPEAEHAQGEHDEHHGHDHGETALSFTLWQDGLEIFAECSELVSGQEANMLVHVTDLKTFKAVERGALTIALLEDDRVTQLTAMDKPSRAGIYDLHFVSPVTGKHDLLFTLKRGEREQRVSTAEHLDEHKRGEDHDHAQGEEHGEHGEVADHIGENVDIVGFLKEQQWEIDFATQEVEHRAISDNIRALGEVKAAGVGEAEVFAPFDGVLMPDPKHGIVRPGQKVSRGEILARIAPSGGPESSWTQLVNDYKLARAEFERVSRLADEGAVSTKRRAEAELDLANKRSRIRGALGSQDFDVDSELEHEEYFCLRAPASGVITDIHLRFGQHVETGEHLFNIIDPTRIWLEVQVPVSESGKLSDVNDAAFTLSGSNEVYRVSSLGGRLLTVSTLLDPLTRRIPVIFEFHNPDGTFRPGSFAQAHLKTQTSREALAIPESAILDEDGSAVVFVQINGEEFARRTLRLGANDEGFVEVLSGLHEGERVVTTGAYKIRLASLKINPADAAHAGHSH